MLSIPTFRLAGFNSCDMTQHETTATWQFRCRFVASTSQKKSVNWYWSCLKWWMEGITFLAKTEGLETVKTVKTGFDLPSLNILKCIYIYIYERPALSAPTNLVKNAMFWAFSDMCVQVCKQYVLLPFPAGLRHVLIAAGCLSTVLCHLASEYQKENSILPGCAMLKW